jgi:hypothetical protein
MPLPPDPYRNEVLLRAVPPAPLSTLLPEVERQRADVLEAGGDLRAIARANTEREILPAVERPITRAEYTELRAAILDIADNQAHLVTIYAHMAERQTGRPVDFSNDERPEDEADYGDAL